MTPRPARATFAGMNEQAKVMRPATYQDVLDAPEHMVAELIRGALYLQPRPGLPHARVSSSLGIEIGGPFDRGRGGPGGWWIIDEPELHFGEDVVVPDVAGWRRERLPRFPSGPWTDIAPDWVCEVLSPSTRRLDLTEKREVYAAAGVHFLWHLDPTDRTLEAFELGDGAWTLVAAYAGEGEVRVPPFDAVGFDLEVLWID
jgi:Uma2 family endonuclease